MKEGSEDDKSKHGDEGTVVAATPPSNANPAAALLV
jgi:hypothetical protein